MGLWLVVLVILAGFMFSYINFRMIRINNAHHDNFKVKLINVIETENDFYMQDVTPFKWDTMYLIRPYSTVTKMHSKVGLKWTTRNSYLGYLWDKMIWAEHHLDDDRFHKLIFVEGNKVILDITLDRASIDFMLIDEIIYYGEDYFIIDKTNGGRAKIKPLNFIGDTV